MYTENKIRITDILMILIGTCLYAFGLVFINIPNHLAEGGVTGITLIFKALFNIDPAYTTLAINIPLILFGWKILGHRSLIYTILGTGSLSGWMWIWQRIPFHIDLQHDLLISALLAGLAAGIGSGLVYRVGGTTGGSDIVGRIFEKNTGFPLSRTILLLDIVVLVCSLVYINLNLMVYTLIASFVFSRVIESVQSGGYTVRGMIIISNYSEEIAGPVMEMLERGITYLNGEGGYSHKDKKIIYLVLSPREINEVKRLVAHIDPHAFISIINVHEAIGEGFTYARPKKRLSLKPKN